MEIARIEEAKRWILTGADQDGLGFRFMRGQSRGEKAIHVSRHHHPFQQIRWAEKGTRNIGPNQYIREGDIAYFPRGAYYGPETLGDTAFAAITLQFGFGPEYKPMREEIKWSMSRKGADRAAVSAMLAARRKTEGGGEPTVTHYATSERDTSSEEEEWRATPRPVAGRVSGARPIPEEGYAAPIVMHPRAYPYYEAEPGVEIKCLGRFYDHPGPNGDVRISMIRLSEGGAHRLGSDRAQLVWSISPGLRINGSTYPALSSIFSPRDEEVTISGVDKVEAYVVEFPRLD